MDRVFSEEELRVFSMRSVDAFSEALDREDWAAASAFSRRLRREVLSMRQNYDGWERTLLSWTERQRGSAARDEAERAIAARPCEPLPFEAKCAPGEDVGDRWRAIARNMSEHLRVSSTDAPSPHASEFVAPSASEVRELKSLANQLQEEALAYHDRGIVRVSDVLSFILRQYGTEQLEEAYEEAMSSDMLGDASFRERAEALMHFTRVHLQSFKLEEDDEKLTFLCSVCPSGGRLIQAGHYAGEDAGAIVKGPRPLTYERSELPIYCCHEPIMERASIQKTGEPLFIVDASENLGTDPCRTYLYKNPADIPERFYTRVGCEKPEFERGSSAPAKTSND